MSGETDGITTADCAAFDHRSEDALLGHDAFPYLVIDRAPSVTFFANLRDFQQSLFPYSYSVPHFDGGKIEAAGGKVLRKAPRLDVKTFGFHGIYLLNGKKGNLPVPVPAVRIVFQTEPHFQSPGTHVSLGGPLLLARANRYDRPNRNSKPLFRRRVAGEALFAKSASPDPSPKNSYDLWPAHPLPTQRTTFLGT